MSEKETPRKRIGQALFGDAAKHRDATTVIARLDKIGFDSDRIAEMAGLIRRAGALIHQRPDPAGQTARDAFLDAIWLHFVAIAPPTALGPLDEAIATIRTAERGHLLILGALDRSPVAKLPLAERLAAATARAEASLAELQSLMDKALADNPTLVVPGGIRLIDDNGTPVSGDAVLTAIVEGLSGTLKMEGFAARLFEKSGRIILPALPDADSAAIALVGMMQMLGMSWLRWERLHKTARYLDRPIRVLTGGDRPPNCPDEISTVFARPDEFDSIDWIANERAIDRESIAHADMVLTTDVADRVKGIGGTVAAAPAEWISAEEVAQCLSLSESVGFPVMEDKERHGGLRLIQWVRGFTALAAWADAATLTGGLLRTDHAELHALLTKVSLTPSEADIFLDAASFARTSRDLFDTPLVRTEQGWLVVGAAIRSQRLARIVPSLLAAKGISIKRKGTAFENRVLAFLKEQGLDARSVTHHDKSGGATDTYQFDVLAPWGEYLFLFECKNHRLSGNDPEQAWFFLKGIEEDIEQIQRLAGAIERWPAIVTDTFGEGAADLELITVVLQNETYALPGPHEGVYVYDWSALSRFFASGAFGVSHEHRIGETRASNRVDVKHIWTGETPTPSDLIAEMDHPSQLAILQAHVVAMENAFLLDEQSMAADWSLVRQPMTSASIADALGAAGDDVAARLAEGDDQIQAVREKAKSSDKQQLDR